MTSGKKLTFTLDDNGFPVSARSPRFLFRYRRVDDFLIRELRESYLWFSKPDCFNDPFDCAAILDPSCSEEEAIEYMKATKIGKQLGPEVSEKLGKAMVQDRAMAQTIMEQSQKILMSSVGLCCFSLVPDNPLMWAHYADAHRGVCLVFDFLDLANDPKFAPIEVDYRDQPLRYRYIEHRMDDRDSFLSHVEFDQKYFGQKLSQWAYEQEVRLLSQQPGRNDYDQAALRGVIFGIRTSKADVDMVKDALKSRARVDYAVAQYDRTSGKILTPIAENYLVEMPVAGLRSLHPVSIRPSKRKP